MVAGIDGQWAQVILVLIADGLFLAVVYGWVKSKMAAYDQHLKEADDVRELLIRLDERVKDLRRDVREMSGKPPLPEDD